MAAATSFIADVIFLVFLTEPTRSRSSRIDAPICGASATRAKPVGMATAALLRPPTEAGPWKAAAPATIVVM